MFKEKGSVAISVVQMSANVNVDVTNSSQTLQIGLKGATIAVGAINLTFTGNWLDWLINILKPFIQNAIKSALETKFPTIIGTLIGTVNADLMKIPTSIPLEKIAYIRIGLTEPPSCVASASGNFVSAQVRGVVWCGVVWCGVVWCGVVWCGVVWCGVVWCGVVWCGVVWCGVVWCGVVWCGVVWCGVV